MNFFSTKSAATETNSHTFHGVVLKGESLAEDLCRGRRPSGNDLRISQLISMLDLSPVLADAASLPGPWHSRLNRFKNRLYLSSDLSEYELRYQIVLEIGHHLLFPEHDRLAVTGKGSWARTDLGRAWARSFLIPGSMLPAIPSGIPNDIIPEMSREFRVPEDVLEDRLFDIEYLELTAE